MRPRLAGAFYLGRWRPCLRGEPRLRINSAARPLGSRLFGRLSSPNARGGGLLLLRIEAGSESIHEVHDGRRQDLSGGLDLLAGLLARQQVPQRALVAVLKLLRLEMPGLALDDMPREIEHVLREVNIRNVV